MGSFFQTMEAKTSSVAGHPFVSALEEMMEAYGEQWPPRPAFENWPKSFLVYQVLADEMPAKLAEFNNVQQFRKWMCHKLDGEVNLDRVMLDLEDHLRHNNKILLGLSAALVFLAYAYRWGTIPYTEEEKMRKTLEFPEKLWTPFEKINNFYGLMQKGCAFTLILANGVYKDNKLIDLRFYFNYDSQIATTEKNFFISFLHMENIWKPALYAMNEYLILTEEARQSYDNAEKLLGPRVKLLQDIRETLTSVAKVFRSSMKETSISSKDWARYVQPLPSWNINGVDSGISGGESLTFLSLDEFLGILGKGVLFRDGQNKQLAIPFHCRKCINSLADESRRYRFDSFLNLPEDSDPLKEAKDDIISVLYTWRLLHVKVASRYLATSSMTSGGTVDKTIIGEETLAETGVEMLLERAHETASYLSRERRPEFAHEHTVNNAITIMVNSSVHLGAKLLEFMGYVMNKVLSWIQ